jgi:hypothetical protein
MMIGTRMRLRGWFALALLAGMAGLVDAKNAIKISADPNEKQKDDGFLADSLIVRPNVAEEFFVFVKNPTGEKQTLTVQLRDGQGKTIIAQGKIELDADDTKRVKLEKAPPPPAPKDAVPKEPAPKIVPPPPEPPPGVELKLSGKRFEFQLWLLAGDKVLEDEKRTIAVLMTQPGNEKFPVAKPQAKTTTVSNQHEIGMPVTASATLRGGPALVELVIPLQDTLSANLRSGIYRRTIAKGQQNAALQADDLPFKADDNKKVRFHVNVDGLQRAFVYETDFRANPEATVDALTPPAVCVMPVAAERFVLAPFKDGGKLLKPRYSVKPSDKTPVRIEVDNAPPDAIVELRLDHSDKGAFTAADVIDFKSARDERVYLDFQSEDGGLQARYTATDRIHQLDTRSLRGTFGVQAVLKDKDGMELAKDHFILVLDDTGPEGAAFVDLPTKHIKGTLLTLKAAAIERESTITQAVFFLGKPVDGKLPDVKVEGELVDPKQGLWVGQLPIPDKKGMIEVGVQFTNETGISATKTQKIELIDPPLAGTISGVVELGGRGQAKVVVSLRDGEGKEKGSAVTEDENDNKPDTPKDQRKVNGKFKFENVPPGTYRLVANKPDSGVGTKGSAPAQVQIGKETEVTLSLSRKP